MGPQHHEAGTVLTVSSQDASDSPGPPERPWGGSARCAQRHSHSWRADPR